MRRPVLPAAIVAVVGLSLMCGTPTSATTPPPPSSTIPSPAVPTPDSVVATPSSTPTDGTATTTTLVAGSVPLPTIPRAGSAVGDLAKHGDEQTWTLRRAATMVGLAIAALAVAGYIYGRIRSIGPRPPRPRSTAIARPD